MWSHYVVVVFFFCTPTTIFLSLFLLLYDDKKKKLKGEGERTKVTEFRKSGGEGVGGFKTCLEGSEWGGRGGVDGA